MPVLSFGLREELTGTGVEGVLRDEMREETAAVNEDVFHRSSAYTSARCVYFSVETVLKPEWNVPARPSQLAIASRRCSSIDASRPSPCSASTIRLRSPSDRRRAASGISPRM